MALYRIEGGSVITGLGQFNTYSFPQPGGASISRGDGGGCYDLKCPYPYVEKIINVNGRPIRKCCNQFVTFPDRGGILK